MSIAQGKPGEIIDVRPFGASASPAKARTVVKTGDLEVVRLAVPAGKDIWTHTSAPGEITIQCLEGRVAFTARGRTRELAAGQFLCLPQGEPYGVKGIEDSSLLVTMLLPKRPLFDATRYQPRSV